MSTRPEFRSRSANPPCLPRYQADPLYARAVHGVDPPPVTSRTGDGRGAAPPGPRERTLAVRSIVTHTPWKVARVESIIPRQADKSRPRAQRPRMSEIAVTYVTRHVRGLRSTSQRAVLLTVAAMCSDRGWTRVTQALIADAVELGVRQVKRHMTALVEAGALQRSGRAWIIPGVAGHDVTSCEHPGCAPRPRSCRPTVARTHRPGTGTGAIRPPTTAPTRTAPPVPVPATGTGTGESSHPARSTPVPVPAIGAGERPPAGAVPGAGNPRPRAPRVAQPP